LVNDIFREIGVRRRKIESIKRFKKTAESETSPILVELKTRGDKLEVLKNAKNLKNSSQFEKVFIGLDQTLAEITYTKGLIKNVMRKIVVLQMVVVLGMVFVTESNNNKSNNKKNDKNKKTYIVSNPNRSLKFMYTNATSLDNKMSDFCANIISNEADIVMISETWFKTDSIMGWCMYFCKNDIKSCELSDDLDEYSELEHIWCENI
ncbi:unnamed protein product, partial [Brachionus calyciflorus]